MDEYYIVGNRAFTDLEDARNYCLECDFDYNCIIATTPIQNDPEEFIEELEERQHKSGFYAFQDLMDSFRYER